MRRIFCCRQGAMTCRGLVGAGFKPARVAVTTRGRATQPTAKKTRRLSCELTGQDTRPGGTVRNGKPAGRARDPTAAPRWIEPPRGRTSGRARSGPASRGVSRTRPPKPPAQIRQACMSDSPARVSRLVSPTWAPTMMPMPFRAALPARSSERISPPSLDTRRLTIQEPASSRASSCSPRKRLSSRMIFVWQARATSRNPPRSPAATAPRWRRYRRQAPGCDG